ncbi:MAG TPA: hypothetical protein VFW68_04500, partial [Rhodocyclaceae bacterium]|nr:hypothetical protein [Rhodocyclaceae bacterium]
SSTVRTPAMPLPTNTSFSFFISHPFTATAAGGKPATQKQQRRLTWMREFRLHVDAVVRIQFGVAVDLGFCLATAMPRDSGSA